jgi:hypothetical protein
LLLQEVLGQLRSAAAGCSNSCVTCRAFAAAGDPGAAAAAAPTVLLLVQCLLLQAVMELPFVAVAAAAASAFS